MKGLSCQPIPLCALLHLGGWLPHLLSLSLLKIAAFSEIPLHTTSSVNLRLAVFVPTSCPGSPQEARVCLDLCLSLWLNLVFRLVSSSGLCWLSSPSCLALLHGVFGMKLWGFTGWSSVCWKKVPALEDCTCCFILVLYCCETWDVS